MKSAVIFQGEVPGEGRVLCVGSVPGPEMTKDVRDVHREFIRSAAPFLATLHGRCFRPEKNPGVQVTFLAADEAGFRTGWYLSGGGTATHYVWRGPRPPVGFPDEALAAMKAATALLIEPVECE